jgi:hypothetical protein
MTGCVLQHPSVIHFCLVDHCERLLRIEPSRLLLLLTIGWNITLGLPSVSLEALAECFLLPL